MSARLSLEIWGLSERWELPSAPSCAGLEAVLCVCMCMRVCVRVCAHMCTHARAYPSMHCLWVNTGMHT